MALDLNISPIRCLRPPQSCLLRAAYFHSRTASPKRNPRQRFVSGRGGHGRVCTRPAHPSALVVSPGGPTACRRRRMGPARITCCGRCRGEGACLLIQAFAIVGSALIGCRYPSLTSLGAWSWNLVVSCSSFCWACCPRSCCVCTFRPSWQRSRPRRRRNRPTMRGGARRRRGRGCWRHDFVQLDRSLRQVLDIRLAVDEVRPDALCTTDSVARRG